MVNYLKRLFAQVVSCPRELQGYTCHRYNPRYDYYCSECQRSGKPMTEPTITEEIV